MTVRELIHKLMECDLDADVEVEFPTLQVDKDREFNRFQVEGVFSDKYGRYLVLAAEDFEYEG